jgi:carbon-monoxide dehydrogenase large subunit
MKLNDSKFLVNRPSDRAHKYIGARLRTKEGLRLVTGKGVFTDDVKLPNMLRATFLRSPYAHARIKKIDVTNASRMRNVVLAITGEDARFECYSASVGNEALYKRYALTTDKTIYAGEPVAAVVAEDPGTAEDALDLIDIDYEPLPVVLDVEDALKPNAPRVHEEMRDNVYWRYHYDFGNGEGVATKAAYVLEERFTNAGYTGAPIETRSCLASYNQFTGELDVWVNNQLIHPLKTLLSGWLNIPEHLITLQVQDIGGAFGTKCGGFPEEVATCVLSILTKRPVKWTESRRENMLSSAQVHEITHDVRVEVDKNGLLMGLDDKITANIGAYAGVGNFETVTHYWMYLPGPYKLPRYSVDVCCVATNKGPFGPVRGFGRIMGSFVIERVMDLVAKRIGLDPAELRQRNMIRSSEFPYTLVTGMHYDKNRFVECFEKAIQEFGYSGWREKQAKLRRHDGRRIGIGISQSIGPSGLDASRSQGIPGWETIWMRMDPKGKITVATGLCAHGQCHETMLSQIAAEELSVDIDDVLVIHGNTRATPYSLGTWSDRSGTWGVPPA